MTDIVKLEFGYDTTNDGVYVAEDGKVVWWEQSFDSIDQYLMMCKPGMVVEIQPFTERALPEDDPFGDES